MDEIIEFETGGHKYKARYCRMYGYYWVTSDTGYTFKVCEEELKDVFDYKESIERTSNK